MDNENKREIDKIFKECAKDKFFQPEQLKKFYEYIETMSEIKDFNKLFIEYLDMDGSLSFYFNLGKKITLDVTFFPNNEICYAIKYDGSIYTINNDLSGEEIVKKINKVMDSLK